MSDAEQSDDDELAPQDCFTSSYPPLSDRIEAFQQWVRDIRDPATLTTEGVRRVESRDGKAVADYDVAPLANGRWAICVNCFLRTGDYSGTGLPWTDFGTREECIDFFLGIARQHFDHESRPAALRSEMRTLLSATLYGCLLYTSPSPRD